LRPEAAIVIAGSRQGLGRALVECYVGRGHRVFGLSRGPSDFAHERYRHICADVTQEDMVRQAFAEIADSGAAIDALIYSAGLKINSYAMLTPAHQAAAMLQTNLLGAFLVTRHVVRLMKRNRFGRVVYLSSVLVPLGSPGTVMYSASKAGLEQMAFALSREFPGDNLTFNALGITIYPTGMISAVSEKILAETRAALAKPETLTLEEIVAAIDFFASDAARQITGQTLYFGGVR
jgi:3-oxoacyl-[acyl-carrier protein] reductase